MEYTAMSRDALSQRLSEMQQAYAAYQAMHLSLNMARGKPGAEQLRLSDGLLTALTPDDEMQGADGIEVRNYGLLTGLAEMKAIFAELLGVDPHDARRLRRQALARTADPLPLPRSRVRPSLRYSGVFRDRNAAGRDDGRRPRHGRDRASRAG